ncbi:MAG: iron-containing alcohol dehydrogenase [Oscillospiraceae bacterium]|jgi:alcohol dehydrogenase, iron-dependent
MINYEFYCPTKILFGKDTELKVGEETVKHSKNVLIVYGSDRIKKSGLFSTVTASLEKSGVAWKELGGVKSNPRDDLVYQGIQICRENNIDFVLGVGGGSVIDTAKAIGYGVEYDGDFMDLYLGKAAPVSCLKIGAILTIPGAGSESSNGSVITSVSEGLKRSCDTDLARPVFAIMDPELTKTVPMYHTLAGAFDAIAHAMERYFTNTAFVDFGDRMAEGVMKSMMKYMKLIKEDPENYDYRAEIMWGCKAAQDDFIGVGREQCWESHLLQRDIGSICMDSSHGAGLAVVVPHWMRHVYKVNVPRFAEWANRVMDVEVNTFDLEATALEGIDRLAAFIKSVGLPTTLRELGVSSKDDIEVMANKAYPAGTETLGGFSHMTRKDFVEILTAAF